MAQGVMERTEWLEIGAEVFGSCIKNDKLSPDKCVALGARCDHGVRLVEPICRQCVAEYECVCSASSGICGCTTLGG